MRATLVRILEAPERRFEYPTFITGVPVKYGPPFEQVSFCYADDKWSPLELARPNDRLSDLAFRFGGMPEWLVDDAKRWAASAWLEQSKSARYVGTTLSILGKHLGRALPDFGGRSIMDLTEEDARRVRRRLGHLVEKGEITPGTAYQSVSRIMVVVRFTRKRPDHAGRMCTFRLKPESAWRKTVMNRALSASTEKLIPLDVAQALLLACEGDAQAFDEILAYEAKLVRTDGKKMSDYMRRKLGIERPHAVSTLEARNRAIKAQAIVLSLLAGRRSISMTLLPTDPRAEEVEVKGLPMLKIWFHETKINDHEEPVVIPIEAKEIALQAIRRAQRYAQIFREAEPRLADHLFVVKSNRAGVKVLNGTDLNDYLNGAPGKAKGLLARAGIERGGQLAAITTHNFRTARLTQIAESAGVHHARQDAGHRNVLMTSHFYVAGSPKMMELAEESLKSGAVGGEVPDVIQSRAQAERVTPRLIRLMMEGERPKVVNITRYGLCFLQADTGPCPTGNPCWLGIRPDSPQIRDGRGCEWQGLTPEALPALQHDEQMLTEQIELYAADPRFAHFVTNLEERLEIVRAQIRTARNLEEQRDRWRADRGEEETERS